MKLQKFHIADIALAWLLTGCYNSLTPGDSSGPAPAAADVYQLSFDRYGNIIPRGPVPLDSLRVRDMAGLLYDYYQERTATEEWTGLLSEYGVADKPAFPETWRTLQDSARERVVRDLRALTRRPSGHIPLVILIHGYNTAAPEYSDIRRQIKNEYFCTGEVAFLNVRWDGLEADISGFGPWGEAQFNAPLVGMELRAVLNRLDRTTPVRILTHSSGAIVAAAALWNIDTTTVIQRSKSVRSDPAYHAYFAKQRDTARFPGYFTPLLTDLRVGMIVPATPGQSFATFNDRTLGPDGESGRYTRVLIGQNHHDIAVSKGLGRLFAGSMGSTTLGVSPSEYTQHVEPAVRSAGGESMRFDFSHSTVNKRSMLFWDDHGFATYMRRDAIRPFLAWLLEGPGVTPSQCAQFSR